MSGKLLLEETTSSDLKIDMGKYPDGAYFLNIKFGSTSKLFKIIKQE